MEVMISVVVGFALGLFVGMIGVARTRFDKAAFEMLVMLEAIEERLSDMEVDE